MNVYPSSFLGIVRRLLVGVLFVLVLVGSARGQDYSGTHTFSTDLVTDTLLITGQTTTSTVGSSIYFFLPLSGSSTSSLHGANAYSPATWSWNYTGQVGTSSATTSGFPGQLQLQAAGSTFTYLAANDATINVLSVVISNYTNSYVVTSTYSFAWHHASGGSVSAITTPVLAAKVLAFPAFTNTTGSVGYFGIGEYVGGVFDGNLYYPQWLSPGGVATFTLLVPSTDSDQYAVMQMNLNGSWAAGGVIATPWGDQGVLVTGTPSLESIEAGSTVTSLPSKGTTGVTSGADGGDLTVTVVGGALGLAGFASQAPVTVSPTTTTTSGAGTTGPGGSTNSTDTGLADNASAIDTGIAAAATAIDTQLANSTNAIAKQDAAGSAAVVGQLQSMSLGGGGATTVSNVGGGSSSNLASSADVLGLGAQMPSAVAITAADTAYASAPTDTAMVTAGTTEGSNESSLITVPSAPSTSPTEVDATSLFSITDPFSGRTYDFDPFTGSLGEVISGFRQALAWLVIGLFFIRVFKILQPQIRALGTARQAVGNSIAQGMGGNVTAQLAAVAISVGAFVCLNGFMNLVQGYFAGFADWVASALPFASMPFTVVWFLDQVFPLSTITLCIIGLVLVNVASAKILVVYQVLVRYITF